MNTQEIFDSALRLSVDKRFQLIEALSLSVTPTQSDIDEAWIETAQKRLTDYENGKVQGIPSESVLAEIRQQITTK